MSLRSTLVKQFHKPEGVMGRVAALVMATRKSNLKRSILTLDHMNIERRNSVCELGPGPGVLIGHLLEQCDQVIGIDHSSLMIDKCKRRNKRAFKDGRLRLFTASYTDLPDIGRVDKMVAVNSLQFDGLNRETLNELRGHLVDGGKLFITQQPRKPNATDADVNRAGERISKALCDAGFAIEAIHRLQLEPVEGVCVVGIADSDTN